MSAAKEQLLAAQETQMTLIEKDSTELKDHIDYWGAVRREQGLLYAARQKGLLMLGLNPVPPCSVSAEKARQAIEMQLLGEQLKESPWCNEPWSLCDLSWERYQAPPAETLKKGARLVEVEYDGSSTNKTWYTAWNSLYLRKPDEEGWETATGGADADGLFYTTMSGTRVYYELFERDAARYSTTGTWTVRDNDRTYHSHSAPSYSRDSVEGPWTTGGRERGRPTDSPDRAVLHTPPGGHAVHGPVRACENRGRSINRPTPYSAPQSPRSGVGPDSTSPLPSPVPTVLERGEEDNPPSPDSTDVIPNPKPKEPRFSLFGSSGGLPCLLISGTGNQVKCYRFRVKRWHRDKYHHCTTTWWAVGEQGSERQGDATVIVTFKDPSQRSVFLQQVPLPPGMSAHGVTMTVDF
uniref:Regulatory protein E2 n=1 Tax=Deer papillomavirus TaxID=10564 RepID=Q5RM10_PAPVD|nr:E2 protein [Deltapapillomavirus 2]